MSFIDTSLLTLGICLPCISIVVGLFKGKSGFLLKQVTTIIIKHITSTIEQTAIVIAALFEVFLTFLT